jgi:hypothetical protein
VTARNQHPLDRLAAATFAKEQRARFPLLHGGWTRHEWNMQVAQAAHNKLSLLTKRRKEAERVVPFREVRESANVPVRQILRARDLNEAARELGYVKGDLEQPSATERERRTVQRATEMEAARDVREERWTR